MYINNAGLSDNGAFPSQADSPAATTGSSDVNFFNAQLNTLPQPGNLAPASLTTNLFAGGAAESTAISTRVQRGMRDTLLNKQTKQAHALPEALAAANLDVVARVKMLGLLVKGVDKIATMG